jgi:hypothetical protein
MAELVVEIYNPALARINGQLSAVPCPLPNETNRCKSLWHTAVYWIRAPKSRHPTLLGLFYITTVFLGVYAHWSRR